MKTSKSLALPDIEPLKESEEGQLQSGFSNSLSPGQILGAGVLDYKCTNNCHGGNCVKGCGSEVEADLKKGDRHRAITFFHIVVIRASHF